MYNSLLTDFSIDSRRNYCFCKNKKYFYWILVKISTIVGCIFLGKLMNIVLKID